MINNAKLMKVVAEYEKKERRALREFRAKEIKLKEALEHQQDVNEYLFDIIRCLEFENTQLKDEKKRKALREFRASRNVIKGKHFKNEVKVHMEELEINSNMHWALFKPRKGVFLAHESATIFNKNRWLRVAKRA